MGIEIWYISNSVDNQIYQRPALRNLLFQANLFSKPSYIQEHQITKQRKITQVCIFFSKLCKPYMSYKNKRKIKFVKK